MWLRVIRLVRHASAGIKVQTRPHARVNNMDFIYQWLRGRERARNRKEREREGESTSTSNKLISGRPVVQLMNTEFDARFLKNLSMDCVRSEYLCPT